MEPSLNDCEFSANLQRSNEINEFEALDEYVRSYEHQWATVSQACIRVRDTGRGLWIGHVCKRERKDKLGVVTRRIGDPYTSWEDWVWDAAPISARTIFYHVGLVRDLPDFTPEELSQIKPEAAKVLRRLSTRTRRDPVVREAATRKKQVLVETVKTYYPEEHIEDDCVLYLSESAKAEFDEAKLLYRAETGEDLSCGEFIVFLCQEYRQGRL